MPTGLLCFPGHALVEVVGADLRQFFDLVLEEVVGTGNDLVLDGDALCVFNLETRLCTASGAVTVSFSPFTNRPEAGQGARNEKS